MRKEFTGKHMLGVMVGGFGIVIAVNFTMAALASNGFSGVVVENSYVASQKYNGWLAEARAEEALGWTGEASRGEDDKLVFHTTGVPVGATATAFIRRPLGKARHARLTLAPRGDGVFASTEVLEPGRWIVRVEIKANGERWTQEEPIE